jgi:hypothetical protein
MKFLAVLAALLSTSSAFVSQVCHGDIVLNIVRWLVQAVCVSNKTIRMIYPHNNIACLSSFASCPSALLSFFVGGHFLLTTMNATKFDDGSVVCLIDCLLDNLMILPFYSHRVALLALSSMLRCLNLFPS